MKVVLLNTSEQTGGAAVACKRLFEALRRTGVCVKLLVERKQSQDVDVVGVNDSFLKRKMYLLHFVWERFIIWKTNCFSKKNLFAISLANTGTDLSQKKEIQEAGVIHLHWINQGLLSLRDIHKLLLTGKPLVWTLHDMWPFTGICHYAGSCDRFRETCGNCPYLSGNKKDDLSTKIWKRKAELMKGNITFVTCSQWLGRIACESSLLAGQRVVSIPNPLNTAVFKPLDKGIAVKQFHLSGEKKKILFGAAKITDERKGYSYFEEAIRLLDQSYPELKERIELVFLGASQETEMGIECYPSHFAGYLRDTESIVNLYNAVDVFVIPSLEDNLPNTVMEAMACGTPVVGFNVGGIPEMIEHKKNGYVADYKDCVDLMRGIYWVLFEADYSHLSLQARNKVLEDYAEEKVAAAYLNLYEQLCRKN